MQMNTISRLRTRSCSLGIQTLDFRGSGSENSTVEAKNVRSGVHVLVEGTVSIGFILPANGVTHNPACFTRSSMRVVVED